MTRSASTIEQATAALRAREPIFHHAEFGTSRADFAAMLAPGFWEVGASGRKYSKSVVLDTLEARHAAPVQENFSVMDFACQEIAPDLYLVTYRLDQGGRLSRRATIWRYFESSWKIVYHQGTLIAA
ncbi:MAG: DUF4440 domain-containing protein [Gammaproteobacteria bacterium]|nr:MAG: DUF4440 domain-containing protein [Gammaproteobacteria bacterium]